jgi:hypothetical protein
MLKIVIRIYLKESIMKREMKWLLTLVINYCMDTNIHPVQSHVYAKQSHMSFPARPVMKLEYPLTHFGTPTPYIAHLLSSWYTVIFNHQA